MLISPPEQYYTLDHLRSQRPAHFDASVPPVADASLVLHIPSVPRPAHTGYYWPKGISTQPVMGSGVERIAVLPVPTGLPKLVGSTRRLD